MDRGAWWPTVYGVGKNWTWLSTYIPTHIHTHTHTHTHTQSVEITAVKMRADTYYNCNYTIAVTTLPGKNFFSDIRPCELSIHRLFEYMLETNLLGHV